MRGPIDFIIVAFKGAKFDGAILAELKDALDKGIIALETLSILHKDTDGTVTTLTVAEVGDQYVTDFVQQHPARTEQADQADIDETGELLEPDSAAVLLIVEHLWAIPLKKAIIDKGGVMIADGRIHPEALEELSMKEA